MHVLRSEWIGSVTRTDWIEPMMGTENDNTDTGQEGTKDNVTYKKDVDENHGGGHNERSR